MKIDIRTLNNAVVTFERELIALEREKGKDFKIIYFQAQSNRVGHLWHEPSLLASLYEASPDEILIVLCKPPCSHLCIELHEKIGITYVSGDRLKGMDILMAYLGHNPKSEVFLHNRLVITRNDLIWDHVQNRTIGWRRGITPLLKEGDFLPFKERVYSRHGIPEDSKVIVLHVRDSAWTGAGYHDYRNADVNTYRLACEHLIDKGFTVVRIGDARMRPFEVSSKSLIDLPSNSATQPGDDSVFIAGCELYIGQSSGPYSIALMLNKCILLTNEPNPYVGRFSQREFTGENEAVMLVLFKKRVDSATGTTLDLLQHLTSPFFSTVEEFERAGIMLLDNSPEELLDATIEVLEKKSEANAIGSPEAIRRKGFVNYCWFLRGFLGREFYNLGRPTSGTLVSRLYAPDIEKYFANMDELASPK